MGKRGPAPRSVAAYRCGPHGLARKEAEKAASDTSASKPLPIRPPEWLRADAAPIWRERLPDVTERASRADLDVFASYCLAAAEVRRLALAVLENPNLAEDLRAGQRVLLATAKVLGLTPESRARLPKTDDAKPNADAEEAAFAAQIR